MQANFGALRLLGIPGQLKNGFKTNSLALTQASRPRVVDGGEAPCPCQPSADGSGHDTGNWDAVLPQQPKTQCPHIEAERCVATVKWNAVLTR